MKVLHLSCIYGEQNTGGAAIAATRLHKALLERGVESRFVCTYAKGATDQHVYQLPQNFFARQLRRFYRKGLRVLWGLLTHQRSLETNVVSLPGLSRLLNSFKPDIVHVHWINTGSVSFEQLSKLTIPVVVNLHDMFMINAYAPYVGSDMRYITGFNKENSCGWERRLFEQKRRAIDAIKPIFVGPSEWICQCARRSIIGREYESYPISNIIAKGFRFEKSFRCKHSNFVVAFGANGGRSSSYKGFADLVRALDYLPVDIKSHLELRIFGEDAEPTEIGGVSVKFYGGIDNADEMVQFYHQCDVFAFPSVQETQGMTKIEAMLCGLPVIAFRRTACAEGIESGLSGWIVEDGDWRGYAEGIKYYYNKFRNGELEMMHQVIADKAKLVFSTDHIVDAIMCVYARAVDRKSKEIQEELREGQ